MQSWVKELKKMLGSDISLVIAGNKVKMNKRRRTCHLENFLNQQLQFASGVIRLIWRRIEMLTGRQQNDTPIVWDTYYDNDEEEDED